MERKEIFFCDLIVIKDKKETKQLRRLYEERNKIYPYPKERGK